MKSVYRHTKLINKCCVCVTGADSGGRDGDRVRGADGAARGGGRARGALRGHRHRQLLPLPHRPRHHHRRHQVRQPGALHQP